MTPGRGSSPGPAAKTVKTAPPSPHTEFGFECWLCRTRLYARPEQIGQEVICPDCHSKTLVKPPKPPPKPADPIDVDDEGFRLSELVDRLPAVYGSATNVRGDGKSAPSSAASSGTAEPAVAWKTGGRMDLVGEQARQAMAKAQAEADEVERVKPRLPERPFFTGLTSFMFDSDAVLRWLMLTLLLHATTTLLAWIVELSGGPSIAQVGALGMTVAASFFALVFTVTAAACCLAILQDTSNGGDKIENWPGMQFTDWMMDVFYVVNALLAAALPGLFLGGAWMCLGGKVWSAFCGGAISAIALFPVFLTSMVAEGSTFSVASPAVWGTLRTESRLWGKFYLLSAGLGIGLLLLAGIIADCGFLLRCLCSALAVIAIMIYFRLLGRLAWTIAARPSR
jgi:DNA-directed RNA polymerase subunit RPC12/RpoP